MLHVNANKVKVKLDKIGFIDCKWSNLNGPGSYTSLVSFTFGVHCGVSNSVYAGKVKSSPNRRLCDTVNASCVHACGLECKHSQEYVHIQNKNRQLN